MPEQSTFLVAPTPHMEAIKFLKDKLPVSRAVFDAMLPELRARAFTVTGIEAANVLQTIRDRIAELPAGADWDDIKRDIADELSKSEPFIPNPDAPEEEQQKSIAAAERRAELILRTNGFQAYMAAQYNVMERHKDVFPYWRYITVGDDRVRPAHAALDGKILPADDEFWQTHFPPWDWGCRCDVVPVSLDEISQIQSDEAELPPDQRSIIEGARLERLHQTGQLVEGPDQIADVRAPRDRAQSAEEKAAAFYWHPGDLRIPLDLLRPRYSARQWQLFEDKMKSIVLDEKKKITVWDWLNGAKLKSPEQELYGLIEAIEDVRATMRREQLIVFGPDGEQRFSAQAPAETPQRIVLEPIQYMRFEDAIVSHNHPDGTAFSAKDLELFVLSNAREFRVVTTTARFIVERPPQGWPADAERRYALAARLRDEYAAMISAVENRLLNDAYALKIDLDAALRNAPAEAFAQLAQRQGWSFRREPR